MISVIGAGPAGCFYASKEKKDDITIFEEHKLVGKPVACTGILTDSIRGVFEPPKSIVVAKIKAFKIVAPNGKSLYVGLKKNNFVFDRARFDHILAEKAADNGAKLTLGESFRGYKKIGSGKNASYILRTSKKSYDTKMIVGADGPRSAVGKQAGMYGDRKFVFGYQARCKYPGLEPGVTQIHLNLGEFSWVVPEDERIARVGVIGCLDAKLKSDYRKLLGNAKIIEEQPGLVPVYDPKQRLRKKGEDVFLIGDAATMVKATTYGGILYGLYAAKFLADDKESYERAFNRKLGKELWLSLKMREYMNRMSDSQANELVEIFRKKSNKDILASHDRDFPSKFMAQLLMREPKLWRIGFGLFKKKAFK